MRQVLDITLESKNTITVHQYDECPTNDTTYGFGQYRVGDFMLSMPGRGNTYITTSATGNCQFSVLGYAEYMLNHPDVNDILSIICQKITYKKAMFLIDIRQSYREQLLTIFGTENVVMESPYDSTNGSKMCIWLVKTHKFYDLYKFK